ncbi:O-antigen ligase family protein [Clostridium sp. SHJSY1]|uniref:O-antigen ligase family protein n=1 Tax=Clostridium sp. SHJSY1 TaxID=2942483 RepID=UPI0028771E5E|nr:O-antigen ligase family protein [Clostridium sp. SHJSY1]MDS0525580.1 O-antigen ligase family protein [Clostridium sp. SHJSY1]
MFNKTIKIIGNNFYFCLLYLFINLCSITIFKEIPYINLLQKLAVIWGVILVIIHTVKILKRAPNLIELAIAAFLIFTLAINLIFYRSSSNLITWVINCIMLLGVFFINLDKDEKLLHKELDIFSNFISIFTFIFSIASNFLFFTKISFTINQVIYGPGDGKGFQGLYIYKNSLALASAIGLLITYYLLLKNKNSNYKIKLFYVINIISQLLPVIYSKGKSAYLLIIAIPFVLIFMHFKNKYIRRGMVIVPTIFGITFFSIFHDKLYTALSARNELWYSAWLVIKNNPIFGVGNSSLVENVSAARPEIVMDGIEAGGLHNVYLEILTANGPIALILFLAIILISFSFLVKILDRSYGNMKKMDFVIFSLLVGLIFVNLFERNLIYIPSFMPIIFWSYLGCFISIKSKKNRL